MTTPLKFSRHSPAAMRPSRSRLPSLLDAVAVVAALGIVALAAVVGRDLLRAGVQLNLPAPPLFASYEPHLGPGTIPALTIGVAGVILGPMLSRRLRWHLLLAVSYLAALAWTISLALIDGFARGWAERLTSRDEYLFELPRITDVGDFLSGFTDHILDFQPGSWTTHVSSHPPLATLTFWALDRIGLSGGGWAGLLVILVGSSAGVAVACTLRALGAPVAARRALPLLVFFPGAVWVGVSADGLFAGVAAWGIALSVLGVMRRDRRGLFIAGAGGVLLGATVYLSYGLALIGVIVLAAMVLSLIDPAHRRSRLVRWAAAVGGAVAVAAVFTSAGFAWWEGLELLRVRYYQGIAILRPYSYFVWANAAALVLSAGPVAVAGLCRAVPLVVRTRVPGAAARAVLIPAALSCAALVAVLAADLTGLSKAETERIWLPFGIWLLAATALLPRRSVPWAIAVQVAVALAVNHLTLTAW